ncbi:MAG TPA: peptidoglycan-binding domain-containing protein [Methylomirabilota bacterium]|nr:peptidoglycan-binding domain-containing protein [Methylomirabilota bacterium]
MIDTLRAWLIRPIVFFPSVAALAVLSVYAIIQGGLMLTDRWDRDLARRAAYNESRRPAILVDRYQVRFREVRTALRKRRYNAGPGDAVMGPQTADALRAFQQRQGLPVTGRADPPTMLALGVEP